MSDTQLTIILASIPATLVALGTLLATIINGWKGDARGKKNEDQLEQTKEEMKEKVQEVHVLVNGRTSIQAEKIDMLEKQIAQLIEVAAERKEAAALLAQAAKQTAVEAGSAAQKPPVPVVVVNPPDKPVPTKTVKQP